MKWSEMTLFQKVMFVISWVCAAIWIILTVLSENNILKNTRIICNALMGVWCLGIGMTQKSKIMRMLWYVMAGAWLLLCLKICFGI